MEKKSNDIIYTHADIAKYHNGLMTAGEMHAIEKAALDDPFLADALDGYRAQTSSGANVDELNQRLADRIKKEKQKMVPITIRKDFSWWKAAAMVVLVAGTALIVYQIGFNRKTNEIAQELSNKESIPAKVDSNVQNQDSTSEALTQSPMRTLTDSTDDLNNAMAKQKVPTSINTKAGKKEEETTVPVKEQSSGEANVPATANADIELKKNADGKPVAGERDIANITNEHEKAGEQVEFNKRTARAKTATASPGYMRSESNAFQKTNVFRGRVTDEQNNALAFSNVTNTRDSIGTYADANGFFNLTSPDTVLNVKVSSIGFEPSIVRLRNDVAANRIKLEEDRTSLSEVVLNNKKSNNSRAKNNMVLQQAEPADGWTNYDLYLANNIKEPEELKEKNKNGEHGVVELAFEVSANGEPVNITVKKSLCEACDKEAIRLLKEGPKWKRRAKKGKTTVSVVFYNPGLKP